MLKVVISLTVMELSASQTMPSLCLSRPTSFHLCATFQSSPLIKSSLCRLIYICQFLYLPIVYVFIVYDFVIGGYFLFIFVSLSTLTSCLLYEMCYVNKLDLAKS